jgi:hypothetical protein
MRCADERLSQGYDDIIEQTPLYLLVRCKRGIHQGCWIVWNVEGKLHAIGREEWVRKKLAELTEEAP